jgi:hypothetical protein
VTGRTRFALAALGLLAGFLSAFLGIGGGLVIVPVLIAGLDYPLKRAVGTSLLAIVPIAAVGVVAESLVMWPNIHWRMSLVLTVGSLAGSWLGGLWLAKGARTSAGERALRRGYSVFLLLAAWRMLASAGSPAEPVAALSLAEAPLAGHALAVAAGVLAGLSSVLFGVGGGIVMVPALSLLFREFPFHAARATSLVTIIPTSAFGAGQHRALGTIDTTVAWRLVPTGLLGAALGVVAVNHLPALPCRLTFGVFLLAAAARILVLARRQRRA